MRRRWGNFAAAQSLGAPALAYASEVDWFNWRTGCRDLAEATATSALSPLVCGADAGNPACIGRWGPLRPRQMRDIGPGPVLHSAKTAVRAMSIAREQLGSFPYAVDTRGKLQQVYPAASACFAVGQIPLPQTPAAQRPVVTSADGRYGWIYWRPTSCCVGLGNAAQCLDQRRP